MHYKKNISFILIFLFTFLLQAGALAQASFEGIGDLPGGDLISFSQNVSANGLVVVGYGWNGVYFEAFRWENNVMIPLGDLPGGIDRSFAWAVSEDGSVVVGESVSDKGDEAFRWTESGGIAGLGFLPGMQFDSRAYGVSADGSVVVGWSKSGAQPGDDQAFRWENDVMVPLGFLSSSTDPDSYARGVSADGSVVVGYSESEAFGNLFEAFLWTEADGMIGLDDLPGGSATSKAYDVTPDGSIVVGVSMGTSGWELFRWTSAGGMEGLGGVANFDCAVSADGSVIVGTLAVGDSVFIYTDADGIRNLKEVLEDDYGLDLTGWTLRFIKGISDDGTVIVGSGINPNGDFEAWRAVLLPPLMVGWNNPDGGDFSDSKNWEGGAVPNENQVAVFDTTVSGLIYEVTFSSNETNYALQVGENPVSFNLAPSHIYTLTASDTVPAILIGASTGNIEDSRAVFGNGTVRALGNVDIGVDGNRGELTVPNGGILEIDGPADKILRVGVGSCGTGICGHMEIRSGGIVRSITGSQIGVNTSSEGSVLVTGNGSQWIDESICDVGVLGKGTITIEQEGSFNGKTVVLGSESTQAEGSITVTGVGSSFSTSANFSIGLGGIGTFNVNSGALAISQDKTFLAVNEQAEGDVNVDGVGTEWITFDTLYIGYEGSGGLLVTNGGDVLSSNATISEKQTGIGSAQVDGANSRWTIPGLLNMSNAGGVAILRVLNGGTVDVGEIRLGGPNSTFDVTGGTLIIGGISPITVSSPHSTSIDESTGGGEAYVDSLYLAQGAILLVGSVIFEEGGFLGGDGSFPFDVTNSGGINPGNTVGSSGIFTVDANYTQLTSGTLFIELGGLNPGEGYDQLVVTGNAQLSGTLDVSAIINFEPQVGQTYEIITANTVTGTFEQIVSQGALGFDVTYNSNNVSITITSPLDVDNEIEDLIPTDYVLYQNYTNPFNPTTKIKYGIPNSGLITLQVYNLLGEVVTTLVNEQQPAGNYEVSFDAANLSSGIYLYKIQAGEYTDVKKMILLR